MLNRTDLLITQVNQIQPHDHVLVMYEDNEDLENVIVPFIISGLDKNEKCMYVDGDYTCQQIRKLLLQRGLNVQHLENSGQLIFLHWTDSYAPNHHFEPDQMIDFLENEAERAVNEGYSGFRITGELSWAVKINLDPQKLVYYEAKLRETVFPHYLVTALCRYNINKIDATIMKNILEIHPYVIWKNSIHENPYYIEPGKILGVSSPEDVLRQCLDTISSYTKKEGRFRELLAAREREFQLLFNSINDAVFLHTFTDKKIGKFIEVNDIACKRLGYSRKELLDMYPNELNDYHNDDFRIAQIISHLQQSERDEITFESVHVRHDGSKFPVEINARIINFRGQNVILAVARDITERKREKEKLRDAYEKLHQQVAKAKELHKQFLPVQLPQILGLQSATHYQPAENIGGDFYNMIHFNNKLIVYLVDITGHGLDGAILNIFVRETINSFLLTHNCAQSILAPSQIIEFIYQKYCNENFPEDYHISILLGVMDLLTMECKICNAGVQIPPILMDQNGQVSTISSGGLPISRALKSEHFIWNNLKEDHFILNPGSLLLLTTDGLIEESVDGKIYGEERLVDILQQNRFVAPKMLVHQINQDFKKFAGSLQGQDDITYMLIQKDFDMVDVFSTEISSSMDDIYAIQNTIGQFIYQYEPNVDALLMGVHEMLINAVEHGNKMKKSASIWVNVHVTHQFLQIVIRDSGSGFIWQHKLEQECQLDTFSERGRGIMLAMLIFDHVWYNDQGNEVFLIKERTNTV